MKERPVVPLEAMMRQQEFMKLVNCLEERPHSYHIVSMGCQMNERDSESIAGMLEQMGMVHAPVREDADLVLYNTCCVRENAENKALGNVIWLKELKKAKARYPFIDLVYGTHNLYRLPEYIYRVLTEKHPVVEVIDTDGEVVEGMPEKRRNRFNAFVNIMYGCNNFCTYCIVPYVRGRERSRTPEAVIAECVRLQDEGAQEIMLLGQNVNSYRGGGAEFAELLYRIDRLGIPRIRFMTSHPKDLSDELIHAFGELTHLMPQLHLPVQAGSDEILKRMNRSYTREHYLDLVHRLRSVCPEIGLTSDIIVGFPGETLEQFEETMSLIRQVRFDAAYTFIYSPRKGTKAATYPDDTPYEVKSERIQRLIDLQQAIVLEVLKAQVGKKERVLVEAVSTRDSASVGGKTPRGHMVNFAGDSALIGQFADVEITSAGRNTLRGRIIKPEE